jgi:aminoglycoside phosphotransferase (APT) family kinase protein
LSSAVFPIDAARLDPGLLTQVLSERQPGVLVEGLRVVEQAHCESGSASTAGRAVLDLSYAPGRDGGLPRRVVLKTVLVRPGAPAAMYQNEVRFYRHLRPELDLETPRAYACSFDEASGRFGIVMEDVRERGARFPNATGAIGESAIRSLLGHLASLHARFWESPRFSSDLAWLWSPCSGGFHAFLQAAGIEVIREQLRQSEYKRELLARLGRSLDELWVLLWRAQAILDSQPRTLLHGDTHLGNTYLLPDGGAGLLDWQLMNRGRWAHDVTYLLMTALDTETRRRRERELIAEYLDALRSRGVRDAPDPESAWLLHRQTAIWGFLIGWMTCPTENYGEAILRANLERLTASLEDLDTFAALAARG